MKILTGVPAERLDTLPKLASQLDDAGFTGISTQENRHNPFLPLAIAAVHSQNLELRTNVAIAFARSPMVAAGLAWDLQLASKGRFVLGLVAKSKATTFDALAYPGRRLRLASEIMFVRFKPSGSVGTRVPL